MTTVPRTEAEPEGSERPAAFSGRLFRKYATIVVALVTAALLIGGAFDLYFVYRDNWRELSRIQRMQTAETAARTEQFLDSVAAQLLWVLQPTGETAAERMQQRKADYVRLLRQAPEVVDMRYIDDSGRLRFTVARPAVSVIEMLDPLPSYARDPRFVRAKIGYRHIIPVGGMDPQPNIEISIAEQGVDLGVLMAQISLRPISSVLARVDAGEGGRAFVVEPRGRLVAHPDDQLLQARTDFAPLLRAALARTGPPEEPVVASDIYGRSVLASYRVIPTLQWYAFVEQPLEVAFAPLYGSLQRNFAFLVLGIALAILASLFLARRMAQPIVVLEGAVDRLATGRFDGRVEIRTGDELESLARSFNRMAAHLQEAYASLERRVDERTRELAEALEQQTATSEVLRAITGSTFDAAPALQAVVERATRLCRAEHGFVFRRDGDLYRVTAAYGVPREFLDHQEQHPDRVGRESLVGRVALERRVVHIPDVLKDPEYGLLETQRVGGYRSVLGVPMLRDGLPVGVIAIWRDEVAPFTEQQIKLVAAFADQAVIALENARLLEEIREKNRQLEQASRHKSGFLANMSHELRTPMNAIIGFSDVLLDERMPIDEAARKQFLENILASGRHLLGLIDDILDLSKVEAGKMELHPQEFDIGEAIEGVRAIVAPLAQKKNQLLTLESDGDLGRVFHDPARVKQILYNLLSNAVKFTPEGGRITTTVKQLDRAMEIAVSDTGIGIKPEDISTIFEEFKQIDSGYARQQQGTGLGLALVRRFVQMMGGEIAVESNPGTGSTFTVLLPYRQGEPLWPSEPGVEGPLVLVVEDDPQAASLLTFHLTRGGYRVERAADSRTALQKARDLGPAAITLDILLPKDEDGWQVLRTLSQDRDTSGIPVVVVSVLDDVRRARELGAAAHLVKPIDPDVLLDTITGLVPQGAKPAEEQPAVRTERLTARTTNAS